MRALLLAIALFCLPMLACTVPEDIAEALVGIGLEMDMSLQVEEDGSGFMEMGLGIILPDEDDDEDSLRFDCEEFDLEDYPDGSYVVEEMRGPMTWCRIIMPFAHLDQLKEVGEDDEDELIQEQPFQCIVLQDGVFYLNMLVANPDAEEEGMVAFPIPVPFRVTIPGPINTHNADEQQDNTLIWDLSNAPSRLLINLEEDDPCPDQKQTLIVDLREDGSSYATYVLPLPPNDDILLADDLENRLVASGWQVLIVGEPSLGQSIVATQDLAPGELAGLMVKVLGLHDSQSAIAMTIELAEAQTTQHTVQVALDMRGFADFWANWLPDAPTPAFVLLIRPVGALIEVGGDWTAATAPLVMSWDPAGSPDRLAGTFVTLLATAPVDEPPPVLPAPEVEPVAPPITGTSPITVSPPITELTPIVPAIPPTATVPVTATLPMTPVVPVEPPVAPPAADAPPGLPLCPEATVTSLGGFGADRLRAAGIADPMQSGILINDQFLIPDFQRAILDHNRENPSGTAYVSPQLSSVGDVFWFFSNGSPLGRAYDQLYVTGKERELRRAIMRESRNKTRTGADARLTPGEVFELSLQLHDGSVSQAMLTTHNLLRALARGDGTSSSNDMDATDGLIGVGRDLSFFDNYLVRLRTAGDNAGPWYHLYGTAYMELAARGSMGFYWAGGLWGATSGGPLGGLAGVGLGALLDQLNLHLSPLTGTTIESRVYNELEQGVREYWSERTPDPEKYCFNVWGAQLGAMLHAELPFRATRVPERPLFSNFRPPDPDAPVFDTVQVAARTRFLNIVQSPFSIQWEDEAGRLVYDNGPEASDAIFLGPLTMFMLPIPEENSWGMIWFSPDDRAQTVTFEAMRDDAVLHYTRVDLESGAVSYYQSTAAAAGDRLVTEYDGETGQPRLATADGVAVAPQTFILQGLRTAPQAAPPSLEEETPSSESPATAIPYAHEILDSYRGVVEIDQYYAGELEGVSTIEVIYLRTQSRYGFDFAGTSYSEDMDMGPESANTEALYLLDRYAFHAEDGAPWTATQRPPDLTLEEMLQRFDYLTYEEAGIALATLPAWEDETLRATANGIPVRRLRLVNEVETGEMFADMRLVDGDLSLAADGGYIVEYFVLLESDDGGEIEIYYSLSDANAVDEIVLP